MKIILTYFVFLFAITISSYHQLKASDKGELSLFGLYNYFSGAASSDFNTTIDGFGSGFLFDVISINASEQICSKWRFKWKIGLSIRSYRFSHNLLLKRENGQVIATLHDEDNPPDVVKDDDVYSYTSNFFSHDKTKIVLGSFIMPIVFQIPMANDWQVNIGGYLDVYLSGKYKLKYTLDGFKKKYKIGNKEFKKFYLNKVNVFGTVSIRKRNVELGWRRAFRPFFQEGRGPEIYESAFYLVFYPKLKEFSFNTIISRKKVNQLFVRL